MDIKNILHEIETMQAMVTTVCLCNPETKKFIEQKADVPKNIIFIENEYVEKNTAYIVKDLELKKALLEGYWIGKEQLKGSEENENRN